jgi:hypothetical protein
MMQQYVRIWVENRVNVANLTVDKRRWLLFGKVVTNETYDAKLNGLKIIPFA